MFRESVEGAVDYDFACMGGGTVHFSGSVQASSEPAGGQAIFELSTDFVGCEVMGGKITIDGGMDYAASASSSGDADVTFAMNGSLSFSGDIDGSCDFDVKFSATARVKARPASCTRAPSAGTTRTEPRAQLVGLSARFSPRRASSSARAPTRGRGQLGRICRAGSPSGTPPGLATSSCGPSHLPDLGVTYVDRAVAARFASRACAVPPAMTVRTGICPRITRTAPS